MTFKIRDTRAEDAERIHEIMVCDQTLAGTMRMPHQSLEYTRKRIAPDPAVFKLVALDDGLVIGFAELITYPDIPRHAHAGEINMICVHPDHVGQGAARVLMAEIIRLADDWLNLRRLELTVWRDNERALKLYDKFGFTHEGTKRDFVYKQGAFGDALVMARIRV